MLCLPTFIGSLLAVIDIVLNNRTRSNLLIFWLGIGTIYLTGTLMYRSARNYLTILPEQDVEPEAPIDSSDGVE
jgi:hypothetical protein